MTPMEEFQAGFDHPPCGICGKPMGRSCMCSVPGPWLDAGRWHCADPNHSFSMAEPDPKIRELADKNFDLLLNH